MMRMAGGTSSDTGEGPSTARSCDVGARGREDPLVSDFGWACEDKRKRGGYRWGCPIRAFV